MKLFVGIDWGQETHHVCCEDETGQILWQRSVKHEVAALRGLIDELISAVGGQAADVAVAIERPHGLLVEMLLEREVHVFSINPKQVDRFRDRFTMAGAKDDRRDALVLADSLRTDARAYREIELAPAEQIELRMSFRLREAISHQAVQVANRLDEQLRRYYPQILELGKTTEPWIWSLLEKAPTPKQGESLRLSQLRKLISAHRIRRLDAEAVRDVLRRPGFNTAAGTTEAGSTEVGYLIEQLRMFDGQLKRCGKQIERLLRVCSERQMQACSEHESSPESAPPQPRHSDVEIIDSLPGAGSIVTAAMLSEAGAAVKRRDLTMLRSMAGAAPVTRRTGKSLFTVHQRYACNRRLRDACHFMAQAAVRSDELCRAQYYELRRCGKTHGRALRGVTDRLLRILIGALRDGSLYDIEKLRTPVNIAA